MGKNKFPEQDVRADTYVDPASLQSIFLSYHLQVCLVHTTAESHFPKEEESTDCILLRIVIFKDSYNIR